MRSVSVVLPESMWAEIPMLRMRSRGIRVATVSSRGFEGAAPYRNRPGKGSSVTKRPVFRPSARRLLAQCWAAPTDRRRGIALPCKIMGLPSRSLVAETLAAEPGKSRRLEISQKTGRSEGRAKARQLGVRAAAAERWGALRAESAANNQNFRSFDLPVNISQALATSDQDGGSPRRAVR